MQNAAERSPLYSERHADNSRVCCARGFAALHLVYCSYCEQRSRHSCHPWQRYRHRLQYPVLNTARRRLTEEQAEFTTHATGSVSQNLDSVLPPLADPLLIVKSVYSVNSNLYSVIFQVQIWCTLSTFSLQLRQKSVVVFFSPFCLMTVWKTQMGSKHFFFLI